MDYELCKEFTNKGQEYHWMRMMLPKFCLPMKRQKL